MDAGFLLIVFKKSSPYDSFRQTFYSYYNPMRKAGRIAEAGGTDLGYAIFDLGLL